ncbi:tbx-8, partial [Pristionchus pacificus]
PDSTMSISESERVRLSNETLWKQFNSLTTEMVVTKNGRKMFPKIEYVVEGLDPNQHYALFLHIERIDDNRYKYVSGEWMSCGKADVVDTVKRVGHQDGVLMGSAWMRSPVCFDRVKITNNPSDTSPSNICLTSMCKYRPVLSIFKMDSPIHSSFDKEGKQFILPVTEFVAVTAYQNNSITQLKIANNPFAKGFREGGAVDRKRLSSSPSNEPSPKRSPSSLPSTPSSTSSSIIISPFPLQINTSTTVSNTPITPTGHFPDMKPFNLPSHFNFSLFPFLTPTIHSPSLPQFNPFFNNFSNLSVLLSAYKPQSPSTTKFSPLN